MVADLDTATLADLELAALAQRPPHSLAVAEPGRELTAGELLFEVSRKAAALERSGVLRGDRVIIALPTCAGFTVAYLAARAVGAVVVNLPWQARRAIVQVADAVQARTAILDEEVVGDDPVLDGLRSRRFHVGLPSAAALRTSAIRRRPDEIAWFACTPGADGGSTAAVHTELSWRHQTATFADAFGLDETAPILVASPVGHSAGLLFGVRLALMTGAPMVMLPRWSAALAAALTARYGCAFAAAPTPFLMDVVEHAERNGPASFESLRFFPSSAPVPLPLLERAHRALPGTQVSTYYGSPEAGAVTLCRPDAPLEKRLTTQGRPLPGMEVTVEDGELLVRGRHLALGYWGHTSERFRTDGWYATGDRAAVDPDGYVLLAGRATDTIMRGGEGIAPQDVEDVIAGHPAVRDVAVVPFPDERLGERVAVVVVPGEPGATLAELRELCHREGLPRSSWPERLVEVDELPRSAIGKLRRDVLGDRLMAVSRPA
jgi:cyclohexanecarboxylate-CoA ligase